MKLLTMADNGNMFTENITAPMRSAIGKFYEDGHLEHFSRTEKELLPLIFVELIRQPTKENIAILELLAEGIQQVDQPTEAPSFAYLVARELSTNIPLEDKTLETAPLHDIIGRALLREASETKDPGTYYEIAQFFAMKDLHALFPDAYVTPVFLAMMENQSIKGDFEQHYYGGLGLAFQGFALQFATQEDLIQRRDEDYPRVRQTAEQQEEPKRTHMLNWVKKHTQQVETWIKQQYDPFRSEAQHVLGLDDPHIEQIVELRKKVGTIVPAAFYAEQGRVWESWSSNEQLEEVGKQLLEIVKGG